MAADVKFTQFNLMRRSEEEALWELQKLLNGESYSQEKIINYRGSQLERFLDEFKEVVLSNLEHPVPLKQYVEEVYYNGIGYLLTQFRMLREKRLLQLNYDYSFAARDSAFTIIDSGYISGLSLAATEILSIAKKYGIVRLKYDSDLRREDYNISGEYMPLFQDRGASDANLNKGVEKDRNDGPEPVSFEDYIITEGEEEKQKLMSFLLQNYSNSSPKVFFLLLCALADLGLIRRDFFTNQTSMHAALSSTFGDVGTRQAYNKWVGKLQNGTRQGEEERIAGYKRKITAALKAK
ncbi:hypothetical protein [Pontibacter kalidii]|uniref:hypothetical protein n=1 Tax=Pontibacter kalidii TaxID=2592049 RepID=UPI00225AA329|nr:hypothetical protein [Pontibacter kalidii]